MSQKWTTLREFLTDLINRMDSNTLTVNEILYIGHLYDLCHTGPVVESEDELKKIITLGMVANYALRENNLSNK